MENSNPKLCLICTTVFFFFLTIVSATATTPMIAYSTPASSHDDSSTVYEILSAYGLPSGLLPDSVTSYTLDHNGTFVVELSKPCYIRFDYLTYYETRITGKIQMGSISDLSGIQVQSFFVWLGVDKIKVDLPAPSESIYFRVGVVTQKIDAEQFQTVHSCLHRASSSSSSSSKACTDGDHSLGQNRKVVAFV